MGNGEQAEVACDGDTWTRNADGTVVMVEMVFDSWVEGEGRLVSWFDLERPRENICTERYFVRHYTLLTREHSE